MKDGLDDILSSDGILRMNARRGFRPIVQAILVVLLGQPLDQIVGLATLAKIVV